MRSNKAIYPVIFVDSNVPMYLVGTPHPNKGRAQVLLDQLARSKSRFVTDVEVYQEILHRYTAIRCPDGIDAAFACLDGIVDKKLTFSMAEIHAARTILESVGGISARDALHVAVMRSAGVNRILSFDRGFDACPGIQRLS